MSLIQFIYFITLFNASSYFQKLIRFNLIATVSIRTINFYKQYFCNNFHYCNINNFTVRLKRLFVNLFQKQPYLHMTNALSGSAAAWTQIWMFRLIFNGQNRCHLWIWSGGCLNRDCDRLTINCAALIHLVKIVYFGLKSGHNKKVNVLFLLKCLEFFLYHFQKKFLLMN